MGERLSKLMLVIEVGEDEKIKEIYLSAQSEDGQAILEAVLQKLVRPNLWGQFVGKFLLRKEV